jgi:hypothetical protein
MFNLAIEQGSLRINPAGSLSIPNAAKETKGRVMSPENLRQCLEVLPLRERLMVEFAIYAGLRPGETLALKWGTFRRMGLFKSSVGVSRRNRFSENSTVDSRCRTFR